jgi:phospholipase/carboxylesterase
MAINPNDVSRAHVWRPAADPASVRTLLLLHGSGADEHDLLPLGKLIDPTANLLSPRGLVRVDGANRFFLRNDDGSFVEQDIVKNSGELAEFLWAASGEYGFDANNVYAVGFSNGANAAGALLLLQPDSVRGIIAFGTTKSFENTPFKKVPDLSGKRVWIANGVQDHYSPAERTAAMVEEFKSLGAKVSLLMQPGGHTISPQHVREIAAEL